MSHVIFLIWPSRISRHRFLSPFISSSEIELCTIELNHGISFLETLVFVIVQMSSVPVLRVTLSRSVSLYFLCDVVGAYSPAKLALTFCEGGKADYVPYRRWTGCFRRRFSHPLLGCQPRQLAQ